MPIKKNKEKSGIIYEITVNNAFNHAFGDGRRKKAFDDTMARCESIKKIIFENFSHSQCITC